MKIKAILLVIVAAFVFNIAAQAQAEANKLLSESITDKILKKMYYERWNGELPYFYGANEGSLIQIPGI